MECCSPQQVAKAYKTACLAEIEALKPGNVHIFSDGHGMTVYDFIKSAEAVCGVVTMANLSLGQRILYSVEATQKAVACNTNLGIILLCAPLVHAVLAYPSGTLEQRLQQVLAQTTVEDAQYAFDAIALAKPGGLGRVTQHDVHQKADCTLLAAMQVSAPHDLIAMQYANGFDAIFKVGVPILAADASVRDAWLTTKLYLTLLSTFPDSHIVRKHDIAVADDIQYQAREHLTMFNLLDNPKLYLSQLLTWDNQLKQKQVNPGTCADLTVASLFAYALDRLIQYED